MRAIAEGRVQDAAAVRVHLDQCLGCRACETACPSGVHYGQLLESVQGELASTHPRRGLRARLVRWLLRHVLARQRRLRLAFAVARAAEVLGLRWLATRLALLPRSMAMLAPPVPPAAERAPLPTGLHRPVGASRGRVALFTGCVMEGLFGRINRATLQLLLANGFEVEVPPAQRCCGALHAHAGDLATARELAAANVAAFAGAEVVVNNSAGCGCAMKEYGHLLGVEEGAAFAAKCRDISELLAGRGLQATPAPRRARVAYDDPCHLCHGQGVRSEPRALLQQVPGLELVPHARPEDCCGSAGIYNLMQPQLAVEIGRRKAESLAASGAELVATGNPGCMLQIAAHLRTAGSTARVVHPVELLLPPA
jgi:glycolate oxidase iron-sulfur subunit